MHKDDLISTLLAIDEEVWLLLGDRLPRPRVVVVGGAAFMLRDLTTRRVTHDIDVLQADEAVRAIIANYPQVNEQVRAFSDQIPYNFEDRLVTIPIPSKAIEFLTPCAEDLVVMKLYAQRPNDLQDIDGAASNGSIDWTLLDTLVFGEDEAKASSLIERRYDEMVRAYKDLKARWGR